MTKEKTYAAALIAVLAVFVAFLFCIQHVGLSSPKASFGSVTQGSEYHSAVTDATFSVAKLMQTGVGTLGSVVIPAGTLGGTLKIYDATTTNIALRNNVATSTITVASFVTGAPGGTYTFDALLYNGLMIEAGAGVASTTITYR